MSYNISNSGNILTNIDSKNQRTREIALQNKVVDNILNITRNARNQINLHMPVDMNEPQKAAENSKAGEAVKHVTSDNPFVKYMMQVQNMVGKQVIGITAVSLKTFFAVSTYYNNIIDKAANDLIKLPEEIEKSSENINDALKQGLSLEEVEETGLTRSPEEKYIRAASDIIYNTLNKLFIVNPLDDTLTCYSNLNFEKLIDLVDSSFVLANFQINPHSLNVRFESRFINQFGDPVKGATPITLSSLLHTLQDKANRVDSALVLSSLLSAATDNAKELILSKINATSKFVDIYTYLLTIGIPFGQIADIMKSPIFNEVVKLTETNIFDKSTSRFDLKSALDFYIDESLFPGIDQKVFEEFVPVKEYTWDQITQIPGMTDIILNTLKRVTKNYDKAKYTSKSIAIILKNIRDKNPRLADQFKLSSKTNAWFAKDRIRDEQDLRTALNKLYIARAKGIRVSSEAINEVNQAMQENPAAFKGRNLALNPATSAEIDSVINYLHKVADRRIFLKNLSNSEQQLIMLTKIRDNIYPAMKEMETLGAMLGINQGQRTNDQERYAYINRIENFVNGKIPNEVPRISLQQFAFNSKYRQDYIDLYDNGKITYNILDVIDSVPHFSAMFKTIGLGESMLKQFSFIYELERDIVKAVKTDYETKNPKKHLSIDKTMFQTIRNTLYDQTIVNWIKSLGLEIQVPKGFKYINSTPDNFAEATATTDPIKLDSIINIANFKKLMDESIIPDIIAKYKDSNKFVQALTRAIKEDKTTNKTKVQWRLILQMMNIAESQQTQTMYEGILTDFDAIANHSINGWKIADLFYLYNLIVNKDAFGNDSFTRLFENLVLSKNSSSLINQFYQYIADLDNNKREININLQNINYRLSKLPNSKIKADPNTYTYDPAYYTFDLPFDENENFIVVKENVNPQTPIDTDSYYQPIFSSADILIPYVNYIKDNLTNLHLINDPNGEESAYIENGEFYINMAKADTTDLFHEIGHGILATIKKNTPEQYYKMLNTVTESPRFEEIARYYPNKHGSDLQEEVLLKLMQMEMRGYQYSDIDLGLDNQAIVATLNDFVRQFTDKVNDGPYTFATAIQEVTREIMDTITTNRKESIDKNLILLAQKAATIKDILVKNKNLTEDCSKA